ncbi:TIGR00341 family protein [Euzebya tangerina]|uniref:TIGR00341 family protein n=1 Tax=Euzebya tangerina TaxID=591198 RepID=UPI0013C2CF6D|nr:TIGR00341 family protein [Euzebya tangerina]
MERTPADVPVPATVVVPLANPDTAPGLLRLAAAVTRERGRVLGLSILLEDKGRDAEHERMERLEKACAAASNMRPDVEVDLVVARAATVTRGVLDTVAEEGADAVVLGIGRVTDETGLGEITTSILDAAPCDVLLYRTGQTTPLRKSKRVVAAVSPHDRDRRTAHLALLVAGALGVETRAVTVVDYEHTIAQASVRLGQQLDGLPGGDDCDRRLVHGNQPAQALLRQAADTELLVLGSARTKGQVHEETIRTVLDGFDGPLLINAPHARDRGVFDGRFRRIRPRLTEPEQDELVWQAERLAKTSPDYLVLSLVSALIASLGLLLNSTAVIIGAMLVAPLMTPLVALGVGVTAGRVGIARQSLATVLNGTGMILVASFVLGLLIQPDAPTSEMTSRSAPTLLDAGIALASGIAGGYATARRDIPAALAGVAIAAALVPPLCVVGLAAGIGQAQLALGALLLFTTNIVCIAAVSCLVFAWLGLRIQRHRRVESRSGWAVGMIAAVAGLLVAIVVLNADQTGFDRRRIISSIEETIPGISVQQVETSGISPVEVTATVTADSDPTPADATVIEGAVAEAIGSPVDLRLIVLPVVTPDGE